MRVGAPLASSLTAPSDCTDLQATQRSVGAKHQHATSILTKILLLFSCSENNKRMIFLTYYDHKKTMFFFLFFFAKKALFHAFLLFSLHAKNNFGFYSSLPLNFLFISSQKTFFTRNLLNPKFSSMDKNMRLAIVTEKNVTPVSFLLSNSVLNRKPALKKVSLFGNKIFCHKS